MSERTIDEVLDGAEVTTGYTEDDLNTKEYYPEENKMSAVMELMKTPTGEGSIEEYLNHPLNITNSHGMAQILRGLTGFLGNLKYAIVDVLVGALRFSKERRSVTNYDLPGRSDLPS